MEAELFDSLGVVFLQVNAVGALLCLLSLFVIIPARGRSQGIYWLRMGR